MFRIVVCRFEQTPIQHRKLLSRSDNILDKIAAVPVVGSYSNRFSRFLDDEMLQIMTYQTNIFATQKLKNSIDVSEARRLHL